MRLPRDSNRACAGIDPQQAGGAPQRRPVNNRIVSVFVLAILAGTACSQKGDAPAPAGPGAKPQDASPPAVKVNIAAADMGGAVEELTGNYGPGFMGRRLIDGLLDPSWRWAEDYKEVPYPQEAII